ncbi:hypothetical protein Pan181_06800 [Aeoliella mucimassa]|uniref:Uncharacterized protein n=1 Tax=Aeoliella mucimassa TaxID=2527972 RepID=A0A518AIE0_9BACT|nr:hypothetical protein Pan181_06800 [Aeoliella mucimassa]
MKLVEAAECGQGSRQGRPRWSIPDFRQARLSNRSVTPFQPPVGSMIIAPNLFCANMLSSSMAIASGATFVAGLLRVKLYYLRDLTCCRPIVFRLSHRGCRQEDFLPILAFDSFNSCIHKLLF